MTRVFRVLHRTAALLAFMLLSCAESATVHKSPAGVTTQSAAPRRDPLVLIATSSFSCEGGSQLEIKKHIDEDARLLEALFPDAWQLDLAKLDPFEPLDTKLSVRERGLVLVYSGHGKVEVDTSHLCVGEGQRLSTDRLFAWIQAQGPKWATVILNGCETAQVNPAVVSSPPISVISASPTVVTPSSLSEASGTDFVRALVQVVEEARALDTNCDGAVSDREVFYPLEARLRRLEWSRPSSSTAIPLPKLRRNSDVPLPVIHLPKACATDAGKLPDLAAVIEQERRAVLSGDLPATPKGWFILNGVQDHRDCLLERGALAALCRELTTTLVPIQLPNTEITHEELRAAATSLAKRAVATEIYWLELDQEWAQLHRLRDDAIVGVARSTMVRELVPRDPRRILSSRTAGESFSYAGRVSWNELSLRAAVPTVCRAPEGQCFRFPASPVAALEQKQP